MPLPDFDTVLVPLLPYVQNYAWGISPAFSECLVARMYAYATKQTIDATRPFAELWIGTHPSGPATLHHQPSITLESFMNKHAPTATLPYLLKILSVAKPLSIQAHPDKQLAKRLHATNPTAYKDDNHKPEMSVALTEFEAMCNFKPLEEIVDDLKRVKAFAELCQFDVEKVDVTSMEKEERRKVIQGLFSTLMNAGEDEVKQAIQRVVEEKKNGERKSESDELFLRLVGYYPGDVGCFSAYLLNHVRIKAGQAFFMGANEPHAYLKGECIEIMAKSDNVVRAGLTPKFKDVNTLIDMLTYEDRNTEIMDGIKVDEFATLYKPPVEEFQLLKVCVPVGERYVLEGVKGVALILVLGGMGWIGLHKAGDENDLDTRLALCMGSVYYVAEGRNVVLKAEATATQSAESDLFLFRASINQ